MERLQLPVCEESRSGSVCLSPNLVMLHELFGWLVLKLRQRFSCPWTPLPTCLMLRNYQSEEDYMRQGGSKLFSESASVAQGRELLPARLNSSVLSFWATLRLKRAFEGNCHADSEGRGWMWGIRWTDKGYWILRKYLCNIRPDLNF